MEKRTIALTSLLLGGLVCFGTWREHRAAAQDAPPVTAEILKSVGQPLVPWSLNDPKSWINCPAPIRLTDLHGSVALVEIFRINCPHCQEAAPLMVAINRRYAPRGLKIVTIQSPGDFGDITNEETDWSKVKDWCADRGIDYPVAFDKDSAYFQGTLHGQYYPTTLILGKDGKILFAQTGHDSEKGLDLAAALERTLPGPGDLDHRADGLAQWLATTPEYEGEGGPALSAEVTRKLQGTG